MTENTIGDKQLSLTEIIRADGRTLCRSFSMYDWFSSLLRARQGRVHVLPLTNPQEEEVGRHRRYSEYIQYIRPETLHNEDDDVYERPKKPISLEVWRKENINTPSCTFNMKRKFSKNRPFAYIHFE